MDAKFEGFWLFGWSNHTALSEEGDGGDGGNGGGSKGLSTEDDDHVLVELQVLDSAVREEHVVSALVVVLLLGGWDGGEEDVCNLSSEALDVQVSAELVEIWAFGSGPINGVSWVCSIDSPVCWEGLVEGLVEVSDVLTHHLLLGHRVSILTVLADVSNAHFFSKRNLFISEGAAPALITQSSNVSINISSLAENCFGDFFVAVLAGDE